MESYEDSNCPSMSDSFSLYERYMRSFNVADNLDDNQDELSDHSSNSESSNSGGNIDLSTVIQSKTTHSDTELSKQEYSQLNPINDTDKISDSEYNKVESPCTSLAASFSEASTGTNHCLNDKSDIPVTSEESKSEGFKPVFITSTMENSNNAVDSVPMFRDVRTTESVFKLPMSELSFNGTILKHVQKLKPIVDPITALSTASSVLDLTDEHGVDSEVNSIMMCADDKKFGCVSDNDDKNTLESIKNDKLTTSSSSQYGEDISKKESVSDSNFRWNLDQSNSSLEASFDSGLRSPDMFSDEDETDPNLQEPFWHFLTDYEAYDKRKVKKLEETLQGILPPPSVTTLKTDVTQMLKKYYCFLPAFSDEENLNIEGNSMTPTKKVSFIKIPPDPEIIDDQDATEEQSVKSFKHNSSNSSKSSKLNTSLNDKSIELKMCSEMEAIQTEWPEIMKCKYYDVYYNLTSYSEKLEQLMQKYGERFVGAETDTSVNIYSGGFQSPSSANKRKALRIKMAQAKSPGRRLSHLARRRQAFCSAATINEKAQASTAKMVLIDKNFFPHRKLINSAERKSPRRRTPGKKTPVRKTPGKKTPRKTPKTKSGGSTRKKAMRRLLMDSDNLSKTQPTLKRALFVSPDQTKTEPAPSSSVPHMAMKSKRALFGSPIRQAETKSLDGSSSDQFLKRKRDTLDDEPEMNRNKIAKSLSFGGGDTPSQSVSFNRRASEMTTNRNMADLNETHKKKLLWAVTEALRLHGWRMSSCGFREKASALARLTRKLLALPHHAVKLQAPTLSTSDTMFKLARQYVFAIIQGRTVEECFQDEQIKLSNESNKITGYISASAYQQIKTKQATFTSQIKENFSAIKQEQPRSGMKNILQDKLVNIDSNSNSSSGFSDKVVYKSNSMPSFEEAKMRARRQISFDNVDFPKR